MTTAFNYSDTFNTEANCNAAANGCHNNSGGAGRWNATTLSACADCHSGSKILGTRRACTRRRATSTRCTGTTTRT